MTRQLPSPAALADAVDELRALLGDDRVLLDDEARESSSRDYAWMSPILREQLPARPADVVVRPSVDAVPEVLATAYRLGIPVTPRGRGTGNYGQAVPLFGGIVLDLGDCDAVRSITVGADGTAIADVEAGVSFAALERAAAPLGFEVAVMPSMTGSTVGGFLSGGNQGVGSIANGSIWDGWVRGLDLAGCGPDPVAFSVEGAEIGQHLHTYGTGGVITGARLGLVPAVERVVVFAAFGGLADAARAGRDLMDVEPAPRAVSVDDPEIATCLPRHAGMRRATMLRVAIGTAAVERARAIVESHGGVVTAIDPHALNNLYSSVYNHATLRALRVDRDLCSLQIRGWAIIDRLAEVRAVLPDTRIHLDGNAPAKHGKGYSGLLLSRWVDRSTLEAGERRLRELGVIVISPHTWMLGGHGNTDEIRQVARRVDPSGLLNPGKLPDAA